MCQLRALLDAELGKVESARPKLAIVKVSAAAKEPPIQRPPIFAIGPMEARLRSARR